MPKFNVALTDTGSIVWTGSADTPLGACRSAAASARLLVSQFTPYEFEPPAHKEDDVERVVVSVYRADAGQVTLDESDYVGTFMALAD
jgi:hypothetical protein